VIDGAPEVDHLAIELHVHLVEVPLPLPEVPHPVHPLTPDVRGEKWPEPVPPMAHGLVADVDAALEQQVFNVSQAEREAHIHQHHQPDHLRRRMEIAERAGGLARAWHAGALRGSGQDRQPVRLL